MAKAFVVIVDGAGLLDGEAGPGMGRRSAWNGPAAGVVCCRWIRDW